MVIGGRGLKGKKKTYLNITEARGRKWVHKNGSTWQMLEEVRQGEGWTCLLNLVFGNLGKSLITVLGIGFKLKGLRIEGERRKLILWK